MYQLSYYAETYPSLMWNDARVEAWINGDPSGADWWQEQGGAWVNVSWDGEFCGYYTGQSNHWEIEGWQWYSIYQGYTDGYTVHTCA